MGREFIGDIDVCFNQEKTVSFFSFSINRAIRYWILSDVTMQHDMFAAAGTGKTLVSVMTLSCMLQLNPRRPVLFLVDKVLLVLQQSKYITNELGNRKYKR